MNPDGLAPKEHEALRGDEMSVLSRLHFLDRVHQRADHTLRRVTIWPHAVRMSAPHGFVGVCGDASMSDLSSELVATALTDVHAQEAVVRDALAAALRAGGGVIPPA